MHPKRMIPVPPKRRTSGPPADPQSERPAMLIALMLFLGFGAMIFFSARTLMTTLELSRIFVALAVVLSLIPRRFFPEIFQARKYFKVLLVLGGMTPIVTSCLLLLNFFVNTQRYEKEAWVENYNLYDNGYVLEVKLEDDFLKNKEQMRRFQRKDHPGHPQKVVYTLGQGLLGIEVIRKRELIEE